MAGRRLNGVATADRALDVAEELVQQRGFNGFSYADVAAELGITNASLHYHFPSKSDLGVALIERYSLRFAEALEEIDARHDSVLDRLGAFVELYAGVLRQGRMCLCGMLASDFDTLSVTMGEMVLQFFEDTEKWLAGLLNQGRTSGVLRFAGTPEDGASMLIAGLEGAMLLSRPHRDIERFRRMALQLTAGLGLEVESAETHLSLSSPLITQT